MSLYKIKLRYTDGLWRKYLRVKQGFTCQKCGRAYSPDNAANLQVAHFHSRRHENTRFDAENTLLLCGIPCHQYFDTHRTEFEEFMLNRLGQERYDLLELKAHITKKRDDRGDALVIRAMIKELEHGEPITIGNSTLVHMD